MKHYRAEIRDPLDEEKGTQGLTKTLDFKLNFNTVYHKITGVVDLIGGALVEGEYRSDATKYFKLTIKSPNTHLH